MFGTGSRKFGNSGNFDVSRAGRIMYLLRKRSFEKSVFQGTFTASC